MNVSRVYLYVKVLSAAGVPLAIYLLWEQFAAPATFRPCTINATVNCDAIISGAVSKTFGLPTPLIGLVGYVVIFISSVFRKKKVMLGMTAFGLIFCLWIAYQEIFLLHVICLVCIGCQIIMISVFGLAVLLVKKEVGIKT